MKRLLQYPILLFFATFIIGFSTLDIIFPTREFSETENRTLAQKPLFTIEKLFNGQFTQEFENYINDQFVARDEWITLKSFSERALFKIMNNNIVYGHDEYLFDLVIDIDHERLNKNIQYLNEFAALYPNENIHYALIPSSDTILTHKLPVGYPGVNQKELIKEITSSLPIANVIDLVQPLTLHQEENIYFRTDHHWTTLGAYYAYTELCESLNIKPINLQELVPQVVDNFRGTYYAKAKNLSIQPDEIIYYDFDQVSVRINGQLVDGLYDKNKFEVNDKYAAFIYGNNGLTSIENNNAPDKKLLIIKDSYTNSIAPYFTENFNVVDLVDLRHFNGSLKNLMNDSQYDDILFLFSVSNFTTEVNIARLRY